VFGFRRAPSEGRIRPLRQEPFVLQDIYKEVILDHYKSPRNKHDLPGAELSCTRNNPLCGDEVTVLAHVEDGRIAGVAFQGSGCSISQSSASMMTEAVGGRPVEEALRLAADFRGMMAGEVEPDEQEFGDLIALKGVVRYPIRIKCAVLAWDVLQEALDGAGAATGAAPHSIN
jgi:nitrogen fixation NifU-like protein